MNWLDKVLILLQNGQISRQQARATIEQVTYGDPMPILPEPVGEPLPEQTVAADMFAALQAEGIAPE